MRSRWDMQSSPPDILITNYSMLNIMLLRTRDDAFFAATREWLDGDSSRVFTVIVDELHTYRGTAGSEVAYLIRNLLQRLDLLSRPAQVRFLAASASLEKGRDDRFLTQFFARESPPTIVEGKLEVTTSDARDLSDFASRFAALRDETDSATVGALLHESHAAAALLNVCTDEANPRAAR